MHSPQLITLGLGMACCQCKSFTSPLRW